MLHWTSSLGSSNPPHSCFAITPLHLSCIGFLDFDKFFTWKCSQVTFCVLVEALERPETLNGARKESSLSSWYVRLVIALLATTLNPTPRRSRVVLIVRLFFVIHSSSCTCLFKSIISILAGQNSNHKLLAAGCHSCRKRHRKCDEERPSCHSCQLRGIACEYPAYNIRWSAPNQAVPPRQETRDWTHYTSPTPATNLQPTQNEASPKTSSALSSQRFSEGSVEPITCPLLDDEDTSSATDLAFMSSNAQAAPSEGLAGLGPQHHTADLWGPPAASPPIIVPFSPGGIDSRLWALGDVVASTDVSDEDISAGETLAFTYCT